MNHIRRARRHIAVLASLAFAWVGLAAAAPAAFAGTALVPVGDDDGTPASTVQTVTRVPVVGGMPGWQIALIAAGAALAAAAAAVLAYRALSSRRQAAVAAA